MGGGAGVVLGFLCSLVPGQAEQVRELGDNERCGD